MKVSRKNRRLNVVMTKEGEEKGHENGPLKTIIENRKNKGRGRPSKGKKAAGLADNSERVANPKNILTDSIKLRRSSRVQEKKKPS